VKQRRKLLRSSLERWLFRKSDKEEIEDKYLRGVGAIPGDFEMRPVKPNDDLVSIPLLNYPPLAPRAPVSPWDPSINLLDEKRLAEFRWRLAKAKQLDPLDTL